MLVSFGPRHVVYGGAIFQVLRDGRPGLRMRLMPFRGAGEAAARLRPHPVIPEWDVPAEGAAMVKIPTAPTEPTTMRAGTTARTVINSSFRDLLAFVDELERSAGGTA